MGMSLDRMLYLQAKGHLSRSKNKLLDIGPQNVYHITDDQISRFLENQNGVIPGQQLEAEIKRVIYFSTPRPGERTTLLSELTDLTDIEYNSFDVCPGLKTEIVDLNYDSLSERYREYYDIVLDFGTTEHIFNQWNSFRIMHDALKPGGVLYCQLPAGGWLDHGYYCYTPLFFKDLAKANDYTILDFFFTEAGRCKLDDLGIDIRAQDKYMIPRSANLEPSKLTLADYDVHAVMQKKSGGPFRCTLEVATAHASVNPGVEDAYGNSSEQFDPLDRAHAAHRKYLQQLESELQEAKNLNQAILNSVSWRITAPLRRAKRILFSSRFSI